MDRQQNGRIERVIISGGGTGGHIFPAISIANALKTIDSSIEILFVGAEGRMEMEKVPAAGYKIIGLPVAGLQRKPTFKNLLFPYKLLKSLVKASSIINEFKPDAVVGVGGYASAPVVMQAQRKGIPTLIQEQNSYAGMTNKRLAKKAKYICVAYPRMEQFFSQEKICLTGNPVRQDLFALKNIRQEAVRFFGLDSNRLTVLSLGGSLGARTMNESIAASLPELEKNNIQLVWQTGKPFCATAREMAANSRSVKVFDFIQRMDYAYAAADIIVSRAGAGTISELCIVGKPAILIPSPNVAEDHQTVNARSLAANDAAIAIADVAAHNTLLSTIIELINNRETASKLGKNISALALPNAAGDIAKKILTLS
jgi:UDP-N-acetylglucosamine--N-acetylmuramyl-(pentapeptide) pyrophosphoryl-undecaprenol N-acetylglucosamine transferase